MMDFNRILSTIMPYASLAAGVGGIIFCIALTGYRFYRKRGGTCKLTNVQGAAVFLLVAWMTLVVGLTILDRGADYGGQVNYWLLSGYVTAWNNRSLIEFQFIVFNMIMFMPLGFLLPLLEKRLRRYVPILLISVMVSLCVETAQLLTARGIFDLDDILHNTLGSLAGYRLIDAVLISLKQKKLSIKRAYRQQKMPNRPVRSALYDKST
jgi:hypothetical protein